MEHAPFAYGLPIRPAANASECMTELHGRALMAV